MNPDHVDAVQKARPHKVDGRLVETKRAVPRSDTNNTILPTTNHPDATHTRIFIGGLPQVRNLQLLSICWGHVTGNSKSCQDFFGEGRGFVSDILTLRLLMVKSLEKNKTLLFSWIWKRLCGQGLKFTE